MKKILPISIALITSLALTTSVFAADTNTNTRPKITLAPDETIISQDSYRTITQSPHKTSTSIMPETRRNDSMGWSTSKGFNGQDNTFIGGRLLSTTQTDTVTTQHSIIGNDYIWTYGVETVFCDSSDCTNITMQPSATAYSTEVVMGVSLPYGVSATPVDNSCIQTQMAEPVKPSTSSSKSYYWPQIEFATKGHFTELVMNAPAAYTIAGNIFGESDVIDITINQQ